LKNNKKIEKIKKIKKIKKRIKDINKKRTNEEAKINK
jgi:hypothetical protein